MIILAIETSCDDTSVSVLKITGKKNPKFHTLSNEISSQIKVHAPFGGVVPSLASREHLKNLPLVYKTALKKAGIKEKDIDYIATTKGPGLVIALLIGVSFARALAYRLNKKIIPIHHISGHIYSNWLANKKIDFPLLNLVVSGGHTQLIYMKDHGKYKVVGSTKDDAAGEAFDKVAKMLNLGYPGGPIISKLAEKYISSSLRAPSSSLRAIALCPPLEGSNPAPVIASDSALSASGGKQSSSRRRCGEASASETTKQSSIRHRHCEPPSCHCERSEAIQKESFNLPRPMLHSKDFDFSFSGLKTAVFYTIKNNPEILKNEKLKERLCAEFQDAVVDVLTHKTIKAAQKYKAKYILLAGGVSANDKLREELAKKAKENGFKFLTPEKILSTDNAAMIAASAYFNQKKATSWKKIDASANLELK